ncbi:MAG: ribonuclease III [Lachnospiraceae bacterium]|nr:ribonuclease III [Lachnospiraceae bacterium]
MAQSIDFFDELQKEFELSKVDIRTYSPLTLAYIGDSIYDLIVKSVVVGSGNTSNNSLHKKTTKYVSAPAQSEMAKVLEELFSEEEMTIYKRGKNAKPASGAKNASRSDYLKATGFEALLGYLYLSGKTERLFELVKRGMELIDERIDS